MTEAIITETATISLAVPGIVHVITTPGAQDVAAAASNLAAVRALAGRDDDYPLLLDTRATTALAPAALDLYASAIGSVRGLAMMLG